MNLDPMDYFLLNATTGELHTARPLDREILPDATGIITLSVRVCVSFGFQTRFGFILLFEFGIILL